MKSRQLLSLGAAGALALVTLAGAGAAQAKTTTAMDKGGAYCFQFGWSTEAGSTRSVLSLDVDPADHPTKQRLWWVSGVEKGTNTDATAQSYVNNLSGTATLDRPNDGLSGAKLIHMSLVGTSFGTNTDPTVTGLWELDFNLQLNRKTLKGKIIGLSVFTPISGSTVGTPVTIPVNDKIKPISCKKI